MMEMHAQMINVNQLSQEQHVLKQVVQLIPLVVPLLIFPTLVMMEMHVPSTIVSPQVDAISLNLSQSHQTRLASIILVIKLKEFNQIFKQVHV
jgi:hypothetical protein